MPFTLSHPAAVLPLRRLGLPMSALVAGSMVPDIPVFFSWPGVYGFTHSPLGVVTADPVLAVAALALWFCLIRDAVVDLSPDPVRSRLTARARPTRRQWLLAPVAAAVGAMTHVGWDAFTHHDRWGVRQVPWLAADHGGLAGHAWLQYGSSVFGFAVVGAASVAWLRAAPRGPLRPPRHASGPAVLAGIGAIAVAASAAAALANLPDGVRTAAYHGIVTAVMTLATGLLLIAVGWRVARWRRPLAGPDPT
ncbi:DUF4184 family protein [Frankia sp. AgB32]|uniref:DUF4184 family protein n=1 Tax=Frankia sp. AgB32 TaxID=631119 RepID=UPI00200DA9FE|nr:DUF4184 family protein [Frankia sp. AgB32]MCK9896609.1 DUF4184 family protein [Frankia sp. AgB32]